MEIWYIPIILLIGATAGFINTLAGGGSLLTLPLLMFLGLPPAVANATNRVAIFAQNFSAATGFHRKRMLEFRFALIVTIPAVVGSWIGARLAIDISEQLFKTILAVIMLFSLFPILHKPDLSENLGQEIKRNKAWSCVIFFFVGLYGGFIQIGVGFVIISSLLSISRFDLIKANAIKVFVVLCYTFTALIAFIIADKVDWSLGITLAIGSATGAWAASQWSAVPGVAKWVKKILIAMILVSIIKLILF